MVVGIIILILILIVLVFIISGIVRKKREKRAFLNAIRKGDKETVQFLISKGIDVDYYYYGKEVPLEIAIENNDKEMVSILAERVYQINYAPNNPLSIAIKRGYKDIIMVLLEKGANINYKSARALDFTEDKDMISFLRGQGAMLKEEQDKIDKEFISALMCFSALEKSRDDSVRIKALLDSNSSVDEDKTKYINKIKSLVTKISDINIDCMENRGDYTNVSPLMMAISIENVELVRLFLEHGASLYARDSYGISIMNKAVSGNTEILNILISSGGNVNEINSNEEDSGMTLLMHAVYHGNIENVKTLISNGADVNAKSENGCTALNVSQAKGYSEIEELLKKNGAWR